LVALNHVEFAISQNLFESIRNVSIFDRSVLERAACP